MNIATIIPFRLREGGDWEREANKDAAVEYLSGLGYEPQVFDDGRAGDESFNRSAAYNRGVAANPDADVFVFYETDLIIPEAQLVDAIALACDSDGLVVPFSKFLALEGGDSCCVREYAGSPATVVAVCEAAASTQVRGDYASIGAVNIVSRSSLDAIGGQYDERFEGAWYDDDAMERAFRVCCGPTRFVDGPGYHMFHPPGAGPGARVSAVDEAATARNRGRWLWYQRARTAGQIRELTTGLR